MGLRAAVILLGMTAAGGLALLVGGQRPKEFLHLVYALLALGLVPLADALCGAQASPPRRALARLGSGLVAAGVIARLFATG